MTNKKLKVLMAASEASPFAKVGGLADVVGSLPLALEKLGVDARVILPLYGSVNRRQFNLKVAAKNIEVVSAGKKEKVNVWQAKLKGARSIFYFIESRRFAPKEIYSAKNDNELAKKFLFFSLAVLEVLPVIKFQPDIIHCHDFHTALIAGLLKARKSKIKTIYTIHNLSYQGSSSPLILQEANLSAGSLTSLQRDAQDGEINFMVQGILNSDAVTTVSKTYAKEIAAPSSGENLEKVIALRKVYGILNGLDTKIFNPATDKLIVRNYSVKNLRSKQDNKKALQKKLGFAIDDNIPVVGMVTRLTCQKGFSLFNDQLLRLPMQLIILGTGFKKYEEDLGRLAGKYPDKFKFANYFDLQLAQQIYAGSDIFLMPSRFEPCGLGQMIAMRYGAIPVVRATGGLDDTVNSKVGFKFKDFSTDALIKTLQKAIKVFDNKKKRKQLQQNCMQQDFSWDKSAKEYLALYKKLLSS
ncbi:MAG: Glycogen synthase [Parcubacteria group bacterium ADurb.Bin316]|nr:MAG: Glycogen synthase [Parcubacteria group bacterium ADurb.Bin316]HOZ55776.1 glycogen/starch synthase [bacterium]